MVAMRVVNNVEREMLKAEWENWLLDENTKCKQVQMLLQENKGSISPNRREKGADSQQVLEAKERERNGRMDNLRKWQESYCSSCKLEQDRMLEARQHVVFG